MNEQLNYDIEFPVIVVNEDHIYPALYSCGLTLITNCDENYLQNICFDRIKFLFIEKFTNSVIINKNSPHFAFFQKIQPDKIISLPTEPHDQIVGLAMFIKLNAIMSDHILLVGLTFKSSVFDLCFNIDVDSEFSPFTDADTTTKKLPWWSRADVQTSDEKGQSQLSWADLSLNWDDTQNFKIDFEPDPEILDKIESKSASSKKKSSQTFSPTIITGGHTPNENK